MRGHERGEQTRYEYAQQPGGHDLPQCQRHGCAGVDGVGRLAQAFGMQVLAVRRHPDQRRPRPGGMLPDTGDLKATIPERIYRPEQLRDMLPACDVVVLSVPLTAETAGLVGREEIASMKPSAYLINVARGQVIDEAALVQALEAGELGTTRMARVAWFA